MDWITRKNLEAELASANANRRHCLEDSHSDNWEVSHQAIILSVLWLAYARYIEERLEE